MLGLFSDPAQLGIFVAALLLAITVHEAAHAYLADRLGDPTPRLQGRLSLNPLVHLDLWGTLLLFLAGFGWGKPVQFDPYNLKNPRRDAALISFAGPVSNILAATLASFLLRLLPDADLLFISIIRLNVFLAVFNLVPVHPLDGGKVLSALLEPEQARAFDNFIGRYGIFILILLILPIWGGAPLLFAFLSPLINLLMGLFLP
ncbi:site-2 protease family protein [Candidatus Microgenomates bacterium]|nr:site-2 protease family protein [Candidatus Microgenomates bacterium]